MLSVNGEQFTAGLGKASASRGRPFTDHCEPFTARLGAPNRSRCARGAPYFALASSLGQTAC